MAPSTINEYKRELLLLGVRLPPSSAKLADYQALYNKHAAPAPAPARRRASRSPAPVRPSPARSPARRASPARAPPPAYNYGVQPAPAPAAAPPAAAPRVSIKERTQSAIEQARFAMRQIRRLGPTALAGGLTFAVIASLAALAPVYKASLSFQVGDAAFGSFEGFSGGGVDLKEWTMRAASATGGLAMDALASPWRAVLGLLSLLPQLAGYVFFDLLPQAAALAVALAWNYPEQAAGVTITTAAVLWLRWLYNWWRRPRHATTGTQSPTQATYQLPAASPSGRGWSW